jgi:DNA-binding NtrC family response regulator
MMRFAVHDVPLLISGPTGTGKELIAKAAHYLSRRQHRPFIPVNCGAFPDTLIENELFGHERGAYTGAVAANNGLIARADGGTLLLDEIDSLSPKAQVTLLRFLQDGSYRPLGTSRPRESDVRVIAATNTNLDQLVELGKFREDLLYRIDVIRVQLPALRERGDDVILLAEHFLRHFSERYGSTFPRMSAEFKDWLMRQPWKGNVRELENTLHRHFLLADGAMLMPDPAKLERLEPDRSTATFNQAKHEFVCTFERRYLQTLMQEVHGNMSEAARRAGKERKAFGRLLKRNQLRREDFIGPDHHASR